MRNVMAEIVVECERNGEPLAAPARRNNSRQVTKFHRPIVAPHMRQLARETLSGDRWHEFGLNVPVSVSDIVVHQDDTSGPIRSPQQIEQRSPQVRFERVANPNADRLGLTI
jgi:hypothetical protein